jgi:hypothetical protein
VLLGGSTFHELRRSPLLKRDDDDIQIAGHDRVRKDRLRLTLDLAAEVAVREVREREEPDIRLAGDFCRLGGGRVKRLVRSLPFLLGEGRLVDEHVGTAGGLDHAPRIGRVGRDDELAPGPRLSEHAFRRDHASVRKRDCLAAL